MKRLLAAMRAIKEEERKKAAYDQLVGAELNYVILKDLIASARSGVVVTVNLKDGTKLDIRQDNPFERYQQQIQVERAKQGGLW